MIETEAWGFLSGGGGLEWPSDLWERQRNCIAEWTSKSAFRRQTMMDELHMKYNTKL